MEAPASVAQDKLATSTVHWVSGVFILIMAPFAGINWLGGLFLAEGVLQILQGYSIDNTSTDHIYLLNPEAPKTTRWILILHGIEIAIRWRLAGALIFKRGLRHIVFVGTEVGQIIVYFGYILSVRAPRQRFLSRTIILSLIVLAGAMLRNYQYTHTREEYRMGAAAWSHIALLLAHHPLPSYFPAWKVQVFALFTWMVLLATSGHEYFSKM